MLTEQKLRVLSDTRFGERVAEEEQSELANYFVETDSWRRVKSGAVDVIYGPKGSGKSALYSLLVDHTANLSSDGVILISAENPRGAPAFRGLVSDPPLSEREFENLWRAYFLSLCSEALKQLAPEDTRVLRLDEVLASAGLVKGESNLSNLLRRTLNYVKQWRVTGAEGTIHVDPATQMPSAVSGKLIFPEHTSAKPAGSLDPEESFELIQSVLDSLGKSLWIALDRLDVAFSDNEDLEESALRALFRVYLELPQRVKLKIFLRTDIWQRITTAGFREASHITKHLTIDWDHNSLLNMVIRRAIHNPSIREAYAVDHALVQEPIASQEAFFYRMFPQQVDGGPSKPKTFSWMLSRTQDSSGKTAPRELIHLVNSIRDVQVRRLELSTEPLPEGENLFARPALKAAMPEVSKVRLEQTLYAEHPDLRADIERLRGEKTKHNCETLSRIWRVDAETALERASKLTKVGLFVEEGTKETPEFWVPFLYRDGLDLVQGTAE